MSRIKAILGLDSSNLGGPGGTRTPDALLRTEKNWVKKLDFESTDVSGCLPKSTLTERLRERPTPSERLLRLDAI
jgi:hypothetical protein